MSVSEMAVHFWIEGLTGNSMLENFDYKSVEEVPTNLFGSTNVLTNRSRLRRSDVLHKATDSEGVSWQKPKWRA